jgi:hypothetical protein
MPRHVNLGTGEVFRAKPAVRRALRLGPRGRGADRRAVARRSGAGVSAAGEAGVLSRPLVEWHELSPGELVAEWAGLWAWVAWLEGRYELSVEERLPRCWARHPGLVEELWALKAWREEIYGSGQPGMGQAARYWHVELRQVVQAATSMYAAGCRTGHRGAEQLARIDAAVLREWGGAYPLAGVAEIDIVAGQMRGGNGWASVAEVAAALDSGHAVPVPGAGAWVRWDGAVWEAAAGGWVQVPGLGLDSGALGADRGSGDGGRWSR